MRTCVCVLTRAHMFECVCVVMSCCVCVVCGVCVCVSHSSASGVG